MTQPSIDELIKGIDSAAHRKELNDYELKLIDGGTFGDELESLMRDKIYQLRNEYDKYYSGGIIDIIGT